MSETQSWLRRPRYSPLDLAILIAIAMSFMYVGARVRVHQKWRMLDKATFVSPLPKVVITTGTESAVSAAYQKPYRFTEDMFTGRLPAWEVVLAPYKGKPGVNYLEIGAFEGASLLWMLENVLTDATARATAIDVFDGPYKDNYFKNLECSSVADKVTTITDYSQLALRKLPMNSFDVIYVDGSHQKADVLEDAVLSWRLLKVGGLMIFDDYQYVDRLRGEIVCPKMAIDPFVQCFEGRCEVLHNSEQLIIRKTRE